MSIIGQNILAGASAAGEAYTIDQSVRVDSGDSAFMDQTWASSGDLQSWTFSAWVKRGKTGSSGNFKIFGGHNSATMLSDINFNADKIDISEYVSSSTVARLVTNAVYRDPSAWYHIVVVWDSDNVTSGDRYRLYVNGERVTSFSTETYPSSGQASATNYVGSARLFKQDTDEYYDGYCAEVYFIDGQSLTADTFGETNALTSQWVPKSDTVVKAAVTFGNNGFLTQFGNASSLGLDTSGEGNNFTTLSGFAASDQMLDSPTNNFATFNSIVKPNVSLTYSHGNLKLVTPGSWNGTVSTIGSATGKWYMEYLTGTSNSLIGVNGASNARWWDGNGNPQDDTTGTVLYYGYDGKKRVNSVDTAYGDTYANGDLIGIALNLDDSEITFYKNGTVQNSGTAISFPANLISQSLYTFGFSTYSATNYGNFGQDGTFAGQKTAQGNQDENDIGNFYYAVPSGYLALCTSNLSDPAIKLSTSYFSSDIWTGTGAAKVITTGFQPDFVWGKQRNGTSSHCLMDGIRGLSSTLKSNTTGSVETASDVITSLDSTGYTLGTSATGPNMNVNTNTFVGWSWKGGGAGVANTTGTIDSSVSANTTAGFSIASYTGNGTSGATIGHGLSVTPQMVIIKRLDTASNWVVYSEPVGPTAGLNLDTTGAQYVYAAYFNNTAPTASVFSLGDNNDVNGNTYTYISYSFHSVDGYSKIGSYTGNNNADGPIIYTGFQPAYAIVKRFDATNNWMLRDNKRDPYNFTDHFLGADLNNAETQENDLDFVSNGIKIRDTAVTINANAGDYLYMAFAEWPFKYSNAR